MITSYGNVFSFFLCVYIIAFCYIYVSNLRRASFIIYLRFTLTIYILLLFYFVFLLFALYIFHLFFSFFVFLFLYISPSIFYLYVFFILWFFPLRIFYFVLPENFIFVFYFWFTFMDISLYFLPHTKKEVRFPNLSFLYFIFLRSLDAAAKSSASLSFCSLFSIACSKVLARALNHFPTLLTATTNLSSLSSQWMFRIPSSRDSPDRWVDVFFSFSFSLRSHSGQEVIAPLTISLIGRITSLSQEHLHK